MTPTFYFLSFGLAFYAVLNAQVSVTAWTKYPLIVTFKDFHEHLTAGHVVIALILAAIPYLNCLLALIGYAFVISSLIVMFFTWVFDQANKSQFLKKKVFKREVRIIKDE